MWAEFPREPIQRLRARSGEVHHICPLAGLAAKSLAKEISDIRLVVHDEDAYAKRRIPEGQAHAHDAAIAVVVRLLCGSRTMNSVNSPTRLSTVIVPPCCWVTMS